MAVIIEIRQHTKAFYSAHRLVIEEINLRGQDTTQLHSDGKLFEYLANLWKEIIGVGIIFADTGYFQKLQFKDEEHFTAFLLRWA